ncbi:hypothetical protein RvY_12432-1 [Ramazzottius varieornatus]|uniref:Cysteine-rich transmembrane CYSTM domain-containing protein n=1 Tax=Ramazzottius varieornatus TaxID=947166 RepID=A0A1D1VJH6_RAMVA|nr:hypothetical protein RvY_12432-1 [Ramazzottius varieornatus]
MSYPYPPGQQGAYYTQQPGVNYASPPAGTTVHYISTGQSYPGQGGPPPPGYYGQGPNIPADPYYGQAQPGMVYGQPGGPPQQVIYQQAPAKNDGLCAQLCAGALCATCCWCCLECCDGLC